MIRFFIELIKICCIGIFAILISQVQVGDKRITDHVHALIKTKMIQTPVKWVVHHFNHATAYHKDKDRNLIEKLSGIDAPKVELSWTNDEEVDGHTEVKKLKISVEKKTVQLPDDSGNHQELSALLKKGKEKR